MKISAPMGYRMFQGNQVPREVLTQENPSPCCLADNEDECLISSTTCQLMSDLHLELHDYKELKITRKAPNLLLIGDIGRSCDYEPFAGFFQRQCEVFDRVLLVPGNHEFYGSSREEGLEAAAKLESQSDEKFVFMHRQRFDLNEGKVVLLGCTLQSFIPEDYTAMTNDFNRIRDWTVKNHNEEHADDLQWLKESVAEVKKFAPESRIIIATHYAPAFERTVHPSLEYNKYSHCFSSDTLSKLQHWEGSELVSHWVFGHTHYNARFMWNGTVVVSNQPAGPRASDRSGRAFDAELVI